MISSLRYGLDMFFTYEVLEQDMPSFLKYGLDMFFTYEVWNGI